MASGCLLRWRWFGCGTSDGPRLSGGVHVVANEHKLGGRAYAISVIENHSRCILASALTRSQDLASYLSVLYAAVERYGSPEGLVTDGGGVFRARQARADTTPSGSPSTR